MRRAHKEPDFHSLVHAELTPKQGERGFAQESCNKFSQVVPDYGGINWVRGHAPAFPLSLGACCSGQLLRDSKWESFFGNLQRFSAIPPPRPQPSVPSGSGELGLFFFLGWHGSGWFCVSAAPVNVTLEGVWKDWEMCDKMCSQGRGCHCGNWWPLCSVVSGGWGWLRFCFSGLNWSIFRISCLKSDYS